MPRRRSRSRRAQEDVRLTHEKRPRQYAAEIMALRTREERRNALANVPEHLRELTEAHVRITFDRRKTD